MHLDTFSELLNEHTLVDIAESELCQDLAKVRDIDELLLLVLVFENAVLIAD